MTDDRAICSILRTLSDVRLDQMRADAISKNEHAGAWRLADGREVLHMSGVLYLWSPDGSVVEMRIPDGMLPAMRVRRHDIATEIDALLKASGYPGAWVVHWGALAGADCTPVDVRHDGKRLGPHGWGLLQSQGYALPPWECSGYARGRTGGAGVRLCTWCDRPEDEHAKRTA